MKKTMILVLFLILTLTQTLTLTLTHNVFAGERRTSVTVDGYNDIGETHDGSYVVFDNHPETLTLRKEGKNGWYDVCSYDISRFPFYYWESWKIDGRDILNVQGTYGKMAINLATGDIEMPQRFRVCETVSLLMWETTVRILFPGDDGEYGIQDYEVPESMKWQIIVADVFTFRKNSICEPYVTKILVVGENQECKKLLRITLQSGGDLPIMEILSDDLKDYVFQPGEQKLSGGILWSNKSDRHHAWCLNDWAEDLGKKFRFDAENLGNK